MNWQAKAAAFFGRRLVHLGLLALAILAAWWLVASWQSGKAAKTEARLATNQVEAATESGADAVDTIGRQMTAEDAADHITEGNEHEIRNAEGADAPVDPAVAGAGKRSLCRRAAYRGKPECLQQPAAR